MYIYIYISHYTVIRIIIGTIIPFNSCHPHEHKYTTLSSLIFRFNTYQIKKVARKNEMIYVRNVLYNNFFPLHLSSDLKKKIPKTKTKMCYLYLLRKRSELHC